MPAFGRERRLPILVERRPWGKSGILRVTGCGLKREFTLSAKSGCPLLHLASHKCQRAAAAEPLLWKYATVACA